MPCSATAGLVAYWRLGERIGAVAVDEKGANPGTYSGAFTLGRPRRAQRRPGHVRAASTASSGEMTASAGGLGAAGTLEGWFDWRAGVAVLRDHTTGGGWILAYDNGGGLSYRVGGTTFNTGRTVASVRGAWHHIAVTKDGGNVQLLPRRGAHPQRQRRRGDRAGDAMARHAQRDVRAVRAGARRRGCRLRRGPARIDDRSALERRSRDMTPASHARARRR